MPTGGIKIGMGRIIIGDQVFEGPVTDFTYEPEAVEDDIRAVIRGSMHTTDGITFTCKVNPVTLLKVIGIWDWVITNCPNKRVVYHMQHGNYRTRKKNWHRACSIISDICTEVK